MPLSTRSISCASHTTSEQDTWLINRDHHTRSLPKRWLIRVAVCPSPYSGECALGGANERANSTIRSRAAPTSTFQPAATVSTHSVSSRSVAQRHARHTQPVSLFLDAARVGQNHARRLLQHHHIQVADWINELRIADLDMAARKRWIGTVTAPTRLSRSVLQRSCGPPMRYSLPRFSTQTARSVIGFQILGEQVSHGSTRL